eukprot:gene3912-4179_t
MPKGVKEILARFFSAETEFRNQKEHRQCLLCKEGNTSRGWYVDNAANNIKHLRSNHTEQVEQFCAEKDKSERTIFPRKMGFAQTVYRWIDFILKMNGSFPIVQDEHFRSFTILKNISFSTMLKYLHALHTHSKEEITKMLPNSFGITLDGYIHYLDQELYLGVFASFVHLGNPKHILLAIRRFPVIKEDRTLYNEELIEVALKIYGKTMNNVAYIVANNTNWNPTLARGINAPFIGCYAQKLNLAVEKFLEEEGYSPLVDKVDHIFRMLDTWNIIKKWSNIVKGTELEEMISIPSARTNWTLKFEMTERYVKIHETLKTNQEELGIEVLKGSEVARLEELHIELANFYSVYQLFQRDDLNLVQVKCLCEALSEDYPLMTSYLHPDQFSPFEKAIIRCIEGGSLTKQEHQLLETFMSVEKDDDESDEQPMKKAKIEPPNYAEQKLGSINKKLPDDSLPSSKLLSMPDEHFEMAMMLNMNRFLWDVSTLDRFAVQFGHHIKEPSDRDDDSEEYKQEYLRYKSEESFRMNLMYGVMDDSSRDADGEYHL